MRLRFECRHACAQYLVFGVHAARPGSELFERAAQLAVARRRLAAAHARTDQPAGKTDREDQRHRADDDAFHVLSPVAAQSGDDFLQVVRCCGGWLDRRAGHQRDVAKQAAAQRPAHRRAVLARKEATPQPA